MTETEKIDLVSRFSDRDLRKGMELLEEHLHVVKEEEPYATNYIQALEIVIESQPQSIEEAFYIDK